MMLSTLAAFILASADFAAFVPGLLMLHVASRMASWPSQRRQYYPLLLPDAARRDAASRRLLNLGSTTDLGCFFYAAVSALGGLEVLARGLGGRFLITSVSEPVFILYLLILAAILFLPGALTCGRMTRVVRRITQEQFRACPECHYSLMGHTADGTCPECGYAFTQESLEKDWADIRTLSLLKSPVWGGLLSPRVSPGGQEELR